MMLTFPGTVHSGYVVKINPQNSRVVSSKDIGFRLCVTPGCAETFRRHFYGDGSEKEHHSGQCDMEHRAIKKRRKLCEN